MRNLKRADQIFFKFVENSNFIQKWKNEENFKNPRLVTPKNILSLRRSFSFPLCLHDKSLTELKYLYFPYLCIISPLPPHVAEKRRLWIILMSPFKVICIFKGFLLFSRTKIERNQNNKKMLNLIEFSAFAEKINRFAMQQKRENFHRISFEWKFTLTTANCKFMSNFKLLPFCIDVGWLKTMRSLRAIHSEQKKEHCISSMKIFSSLRL